MRFGLTNQPTQVGSVHNKCGRNADKRSTECYRRTNKSGASGLMMIVQEPDVFVLLPN